MWRRWLGSIAQGMSSEERGNFWQHPVQMDFVEGHVATASGIGLVLLRLDIERGTAHVERPYQVRRNLTGVLVTNVLAVDTGVVTGPAPHVHAVRRAIALAKRVNVRVESERFVELRRIELGRGNRRLGSKR